MCCWRPLDVLCQPVAVSGQNYRRVVSAALCWYVSGSDRNQIRVATCVVNKNEPNKRALNWLQEKSYAMFNENSSSWSVGNDKRAAEGGGNKRNWTWQRMEVSPIRTWQRMGGAPTGTRARTGQTLTRTSHWLNEQPARDSTPWQSKCDKYSNGHQL